METASYKRRGIFPLLLYILTPLHRCHFVTLENLFQGLLVVTAVMCFVSATTYASDAKEADLAGSWYPASKQELENELSRYLNAVPAQKVDGDIFAIISPHAGYRFSGPVAAYGYKLAQGSSQDKNIKTVIIIGFSHRKAFNGISIYDTASFSTPLGEVPVDKTLAAAIKAESGRIFFYPPAFEDENSVEMQIPFVQMTLKYSSIVPIAFGGQSYDDAVVLANALAKVLKSRDDYLIVASTDLSHYHSYDEANAIDKHMIALLDTKKAKELYDEAKLGICELCGIMPVTATLLAAEKLGFNGVKILKYANSGDTYGDKTKVVGYLSAIVYNNSGARETSPAIIEEGGSRMLLNDAQRKRLLQIARESLTSYVRDGKRKTFAEKDPVLNEPMGAFVTLHEDGELRGCIGNMVGQGPLYQTVAAMAIEAAVNDPRFSALSPAEIDKVDIEISALSPMKKVAGPEEIKIPGNGVLVRRGFRSGVYLPQVATEAGWNKEQFLTSLCAHKAGLRPDAWKDPATDMYIFSAEVFGEKEASNER